MELCAAPNTSRQIVPKLIMRSGGCVTDIAIVSAGREPITENGRCAAVLPQLRTGDRPLA